MQAPSTFTIDPGGRLRGTIAVPGDKSMSHRSVIFASIAEGDAEISGFLEGEDTLATVAAFRHMGVSIEGPRAGRLAIRGVGLRGLCAPHQSLDLGNSGTAMRLLPGVLAGQDFDVTLRGDASLTTRPMARIITPLTSMGARIEAGDAATPPLTIHL
jgi:3-phosphoshikimate 1-carboxyvinyltransferase